MAEPMYRRIAQDLRQEIEGGKLRPGQQLPTEGELRERYGASRNTIRDAMKWLTNRALVDSRPGQGTFVVERPDVVVTTLSVDPKTGLGGGEGVTANAEVSVAGRTARSGTPRVEIQQADDEVAGWLQIAAGTMILSRHQSRFIDGMPWSLQTSFYPMNLVSMGAHRLLVAEDIAEGTVTYLHETLALAQVGYRDRILVRSPGQNEAVFFGLPDDGRIPVVVVTRIGYAASPDGPVPFRITVSVYPADRNQFTMNSGAIPDDLLEPACRHEVALRIRSLAATPLRQRYPVPADACTTATRTSGREFAVPPALLRQAAPTVCVSSAKTPITAHCREGMADARNNNLVMRRLRLSFLDPLARTR